MKYDARQFSSDKILKHLDRVQSWIKGGNPPPITVELDMTNRCNHRCPECTSGYFQEKNSSSLYKDLAERIVRELADVGVRGLIFTGGGEPLCHPDTGEIVKLAKSLGLDVGFITNGSLLNRHNSEVLLKCCTWLRVSLDAGSPRLFKLTHGMDKKTFNKVLDNIRILVESKKELQSKTTIGAGYLTCYRTKSEMYDATLLCKDLGVDYIQFRPMQIHSVKKSEYYRINQKYLEKCLKESNNGYKVLYSKHKYDMMHDKDYGRNYEKCYGHQFATVISASGNMYLCCHTRGYEKYCLGDLNHQTFREIWDSEKRRKVYENVDFKDCIPLCRDNTFNQILWNIKQPREHVNFL